MRGGRTIEVVKADRLTTPVQVQDGRRARAAKVAVQGEEVGQVGGGQPPGAAQEALLGIRRIEPQGQSLEE
jgi:hypothetical protein